MALKFDEVGPGILCPEYPDDYVHVLERSSTREAKVQIR